MTVEEYLEDKKPEAVALFRQFAHIWAGAFCNGKKLELNIDLLREVDHPLNLALIPHTQRVVTHRMRVTDAAQLDESIAAILREAYETVGPGTRV